MEALNLIIGFFEMFYYVKWITIHGSCKIMTKVAKT